MVCFHKIVLNQDLADHTKDIINTIKIIIIIIMILDTNSIQNLSFR